MGTSASSKGPGGNVPLVPSWVPDINGEVVQRTPQQQGMASPARFKHSRQSIGHFAKTGTTDSLKRGLGHYSKSGLGGSVFAARRMSGASSRAGALYSALSHFNNNQVYERLDPSELKGLSAKQLIDLISTTLNPPDGTLDSESGRSASARAMSELIKLENDADLLSLSEDQIVYVTEHHIAYELCYRMELDLSETVKNRAPDVVTAVRRMEEIKRYVVQDVLSCFRRRGEGGEPLTRDNVTSLTNRVVQDTFEVFEEYLQ